MSNAIETINEVTSLAPLDYAYSLTTPLQLPVSNKPIKIVVNELTLSDRIPNVFNANPYYTFNNTLCEVRYFGVGPELVILPAGLYPDAEAIIDGINNAVNELGWWADPLDPGLTVETNTITDRITIYIDSNKLANGHVGFQLDLRKDTVGTDLATTLGFSEGAAFLGTDGPHYSNQVARLDTQGTIADVQCSLVANRRRNNGFVRTVANVIFAGKTTTSDNIWPNGGQTSPLMIYDGPKQIINISYEIKTLRGRPMLFMSGVFRIVLSFEY